LSASRLSRADTAAILFCRFCWQPLSDETQTESLITRGDRHDSFTWLLSRYLTQPSKEVEAQASLTLQWEGRPPGAHDHFSLGLQDSSDPWAERIAPVSQPDVTWLTRMTSQRFGPMDIRNLDPINPLGTQIKAEVESVIGPLTPRDADRAPIHNPDSDRMSSSQFHAACFQHGND
jgi:hypothetical protein